MMFRVIINTSRSHSHQYTNLFRIDPASSTIYNYQDSGELIYPFSSADITIGQYFSTTHGFDLRFGYGLAYAYIDQKANTDFNEFDIAPFIDDFVFEEVNVTSLFENKFTGLGPKVSLDGLFDINDSLSIIGGTGMSFLFGKSKAQFSLEETATYQVL